MSLNEFIAGVTDLYNGETISKEDLRKINGQANSYLELLKTESIGYEERNALDCYIAYFEEHETFDEDIRRTINEYHQVVESQRAKDLENDKHGSFKIEPIDRTGAIRAITIIEVVAILGVIIALILLVLI